MKARVILIEGDASAALPMIQAALAATLAQSPRAEVTIATPAPRLRIADLLAAAAFETGLTAVRLAGDDRHAPVVRARDAVILAATDYLGASASQIGREVGDRDHGTILTAIRRARGRLVNDPGFALLLRRLKRRVIGGNRHG